MIDSDGFLLYLLIAVPVALWKFCPLFEGIGYSMFIMNALFSICYNMLFGWVIYFLVHSLIPISLPWSVYDNSWNSQYGSDPITHCREEMLLSQCSSLNTSFVRILTATIVDNVCQKRRIISQVFIIFWCNFIAEQSWNFISDMSSLVSFWNWHRGKYVKVNAFCR